MSTFKFAQLVNSPPADTTSAALGDGSSTIFDSQTDLDKIVKLGGADTYVLAASGDEIEGFVYSVEAFTVNEGYSFGTVQKNRRLVATVDAAQTPALAIGGLVVAGAQAAVGTAGGAVVLGGSPTTHKWRVISIVSGTGVAGDKVLIERI